MTSRRRILLGGALLCWATALTAPILWPSPPEKEGAFYALGHWWDRTLEVQLPLAVLGLILLLAAIRRAPRP